MAVENRVGVSFIRAEAATEAMVVSMDSSSMSSMSNESTRETSLVASATILKETSLMGIGALCSFEGVGALGLLFKVILHLLLLTAQGELHCNNLCL